MFAKRLIARFVFTTAIVASLFFSSLGTTPVYAAGITVNTKVDETTKNGKCSLREAIINSNNNAATYPDCTAGVGKDTIAFAGNYTITLAGEELPAVTSEIIIKGKGAGNTVIQANANPETAIYRVFYVASPGNLTLNGLTVRHGQCPGGECDGGGIYITDATLTVINSTVSGNIADYGGGIYASNSNITVTNSAVSGNRATYGGAIVNFDGGTLTVTNSTFYENDATIEGGAILSGPNPATSTITNSTFSGNYALNGNGGAIYNRATGTVTIEKSTLSDNEAYSNGGGIENDGSIIVANSTLSGNFAFNGGALYNYGNMWVANSTISSNVATKAGGGILNQSGAWIHNSTIVFNTLIEGTSIGAGGIDGNVALYNSIVAGNTRAFTSEYRDCSGTMHLEGVNAFWDTTNCSTDPASTGYMTFLFSLNELGPLQDNGGPTWTHALLSIDGESRVIDAGVNALCASWPINNIDQRGVIRPQGSKCDVGAYEVVPTFVSTAEPDGWILEASETSGKGGSKNNIASTIYLGDNAANKQYRGILSFDTSGIPEGATINKVTLKVKKAGVKGGGNPVNIFKGFMIDVKTGEFGAAALELGDFKAAGDLTLGPVKPPLVNGWYSLDLTAANLQINTTGNTQIRLRFKLDDNNNLVANYLTLYSGNAALTNQPQLLVEYTAP